MASVRKLSRDRNKKGAPYYIQFLDHKGDRRTTRGCPDKGVTEAKAAKIDTVVQRIKLGLAKETELDVLLGKPHSQAWETQLKSFEESLKRKSTTTKYVRLTVSRVQVVLLGAGFKTIADFDVDAVEAFLASHCEEKNLGNRTYNHYAQAVDAFGNWLAHPKRRILEKNPFAGIARRNIETDVRHGRRALKPEEIARVIEAARQSTYTVQGYDGVTRARIYLLSYMTGLRKGEIASLTPASFKLEGQHPTLTIQAKHSKHRKKDTLPLNTDLVAELKTWLFERATNEPLFPLLEKRKAYKMIRRDLQEAGIPFETDEGMADFHAAGRHTHITQLLRSGVSLVEAKALARHSDVRMTMKYTHIGLEDQSKAVNRLTCPPASKPADSTDPSNGCLHNVCIQDDAPRQDGASPDVTWHDVQDDFGRPNRLGGNDLDSFGQPKSQVDASQKEMEAAGIEPASYFPQVLYQVAI